MSSCLLCLYRVPLLNSPLGPSRDPVGVCKQCNSLSCGWHGRRLTRGEFSCLICDANKLAASSAWRQFEREGGWRRIRSEPVAGGGAGNAAAGLARALAALFATADGYPSRAVVETMRQWLQERPTADDLFKGALAAAVDWALDLLNRWFADQHGEGTGKVTDGHYDQRAIDVFWSRLDEDGRRLLVAAVLLNVALGLPWDVLPAPMLDVVQRIGGLLRDYPNRLKELRQRIAAT